MANNKRELLEEILTDNQKATLNRIADDETAIEALRKLFLLEVYHAGVLDKELNYNPGINFAQGIGLSGLTDTEKGALLSAMCQGINLLGMGFLELSRFKTKVKQSEETNANPGV